MKNISKYIVFFILFLLTMMIFYIPFRMDTYVNYGFSYGIVNGQIPYRDFNIIVPLFSPFIYSILLLFNKSILFYYIEQSFLLVAFSVCLFKLLDKKAWIVITALFCPIIFCFAYCMFPGYNFILLFELLLLLYLEDNNKSDVLIGIISALSIITKQSVGIFIFVVTVLYPIFKDKDFKKSLKRFLYGLIPIGIFIIYLLISRSFIQFIDYCFLGMSDFKNNFQFKLFYFVLLLIDVVLMSIKFFKDKNKNISYYYLIAYLSVVYPLLETYHVSLFLFFSLIVFIYNTEITVPKKIPIFSFLVIAFFISIYTFLGRDYFKKLNIYSFHNFPVEFVTTSLKKDYDEIIKFYKQHDVIFVGDPAKTIFFTSTKEKDLNKYYILYRGNQGSGGMNKLVDDIKNKHGVYLVVLDKSRWCSDKACQFDMRLSKVITDEYTLVKELNYFKIYYKE